MYQSILCLTDGSIRHSRDCNQYQLGAKILTMSKREHKLNKHQHQAQTDI